MLRAGDDIADSLRQQFAQKKSARMKLSDGLQ